MTTQVTPEVLWAQRSSSTDPAKNYIFLTITVPDIPKEALKLDLQPNKLVFTGTSDSKKQTYHVELEFYDEINPAEAKTNHTGKNVEFVLPKKELKEEYWPRLLKESRKVHFLKTDFDKWVDEDEQDEAPEDDYMQQMGGMGGGADGGFGGIDFSKLGAGMPGAEGMGGMPGMGGLGDMDEEEESDDEDMPELKEPKGETAEAKETPKITEIP